MAVLRLPKLETGIRAFAVLDALVIMALVWLIIASDLFS